MTKSGTNVFHGNAFEFLRQAIQRHQPLCRSGPTASRSTTAGSTELLSSVTIPASSAVPLGHGHGRSTNSARSAGLRKRTFIAILLLALISKFDNDGRTVRGCPNEEAGSETDNATDQSADDRRIAGLADSRSDAEIEVSQARVAGLLVTRSLERLAGPIAVSRCRARFRDLQAAGDECSTEGGRYVVRFVVRSVRLIPGWL